MWQIRVSAVAFFLVTLFVSPAVRADLLPDGVRGVTYNVSYENLGAYPQYVFFVYPTTNSGFAYRVEPGKSVTKLMMEEGRHASPGTSLYAIKKTEFDKVKDKPSYNHGDKGEMVQVFSPPASAVKSNMLVSPPKGVVASSSPQKELVRIFRIANVTDEKLELTLVKNEMILRDGTRKDVPFGQELDDSAKSSGSPFERRDTGKGTEPSSAPSASAPAPAADPPKKRGCAIAEEGSEAPWGWGLIAFLAFARSRRRASPSP